MFGRIFSTSPATFSKGQLAGLEVLGLHGPEDSAVDSLTATVFFGPTGLQIVTTQEACEGAVVSVLRIHDGVEVEAVLSFPTRKNR